MTQPLRLPEFIKRPARAARDNPLINRVVSSAVRALVPRGRLREKIMWRLPRIGEAMAILPNGEAIRMKCEQFESVLNALHYNGWTAEEPETLPLWFRLSSGASTIIDVGAHVGHFSIIAALANRNAAIHAFEPLPKVIRLLRRNLMLNGLDVHVHELALSREQGEASFFAVEHQIPSTSSLSREFVSNFDDLPWGEIKVRVEKLDDVLPMPKTPVIMKIDTETTEPDVLAGASKLVSGTKPIIIVEILPGHGVEERLYHELELAEYAFTPYAMTKCGLVKHDRIIGNVEWRNYLLVPHDGPSIPALSAVAELAK